MDIQQGDTFRLSAILPTNVNSYQNVIIEVFTHPNFREKFYYPNRVDQNNIIIDNVDPKKAKIVIKSKMTAKFNGKISLVVVYGNSLDEINEQYNRPAKVTDINVISNPAKNDN